jgi:ribosomal protein S18 acetylase RimI-like enzyme
MSTIHYRAATQLDLTDVVTVYLTARNEMIARSGLTPPSDTLPDDLANYQHLLDTGLVWVAIVDGQLAGVAAAVVREKLWFLSGFWVLPHLQKQRIGGPLLRHVWVAGQEQGATTAFVWSSNDLTAMSAYMKLGMLPGCQILTFRGEAGALSLPGRPLGYETRTLSPADAAQIDQVVRGTARLVDHQFWSQQVGQLILYHGKVCGYYYVDGGAVAPAAWLDPAHGEAVLTLACQDGLERLGKVILRPPGINHTAIRFALAHGFKLQQFSHLLTTAPFGRLDQYTTSGPFLF